MDAAAPVEGGVGPYVERLGEPTITLVSGPLRCQHDRRHVLLAYLAHHHDWVPRERLARLFWPEHVLGGAHHNLRQLLKRSRRMAWRPELESTTYPHDRRVRWRPNTDLVALDNSLKTRDWGAAMRLYRGPLLAGLKADAAPGFSAWLDFERLRLQERWRDGLMTYAAELSSAGHYHHAARVLDRVLREDGYDEDALRAYMTASALSGHANRALEAHDAFAGRLDAELQLIPSLATRNLVQRIRDGTVDGNLTGDLTGDLAPASSPRLLPSPGLPEDAMLVPDPAAVPDAAMAASGAGSGAGLDAASRRPHPRPPTPSPISSDATWSCGF